MKGKGKKKKRGKRKGNSDGVLFHINKAKSPTYLRRNGYGFSNL